MDLILHTDAEIQWSVRAYSLQCEVLIAVPVEAAYLCAGQVGDAS